MQVNINASAVASFYQKELSQRISFLRDSTNVNWSISFTILQTCISLPSVPALPTIDLAMKIPSYCDLSIWSFRFSACQDSWINCSQSFIMSCSTLYTFCGQKIPILLYLYKNWRRNQGVYYCIVHLFTFWGE